MNEMLFFVVILLANIIQGITGFAGTILAMPFGLMLVGYPVAKPVLNVLGLLSGIYVFSGHRKDVNWDELKRVVVVMAVGIIIGILIKGQFDGKEPLLCKFLGIIVILLAIQGGLSIWKNGERSKEIEQVERGKRSVGKNARAGQYLLLASAGIVHGVFVSGGPLLISYLTKRIHDKISFRATISTVWIFLNSLILIDDIRAGYWFGGLWKIQLLSVPFLLAGMYIGSRLYAIMSQRFFMILTYILLLIAGISLLVK